MRTLINLYLIIVLFCWEAIGGVAMQSVHASATFPSNSESPHITSSISVETAALAQRTEQSRSADHVSTVALTFDDGPQPVFTPQILHVLAVEGVPATFFCVGNLAQEYAGIVRQTSAMGNVIGDHSWSHPDLTKLSPAAIRWQLSVTSAELQRDTGVAPRLFRPPYGATNATVMSIAAQLGLTQIMWTVDTRDWQQPGVAAIVNTVLANARNGSIILLHDGGGNRAETVQALPEIISGLRQRGFAFTAL